MRRAIKGLCCRLLQLAAALTLAFSICGQPARAHEIPISATLQTFVQVKGNTLRVLVRVPLSTYVDGEYPRRPGDYVDLDRVDPALRAAAELLVIQPLQIFEGGRRLPQPRIVATRLSLNSDTAFATYAGALAHVVGPPLPRDTNLLWEQGKLDVLLEYPISSDRSSFAIHAANDRLAQNVVDVVQFIPPSGTSRTFELRDDAGLTRLDPSWGYAAWLFVKMGFHHILDGTDHILFLLCLVIPFRRLAPLVPIVTAFTIAHSVTLIASAYGLAPDALWFPPLIETMIAVSILYMALENICVARPARRWVITFCFGLVHGFGFSFVLRETLQLAGGHLLSSLLAFNVGVEIGQLFLLLLFVPALNLLFRHVVAQSLGAVILSALVAHQAWHWMEDRYAVLSQFPWSGYTGDAMVNLLRWVTALVALAASVWVFSVVRRRVAAKE